MSQNLPQNPHSKADAPGDDHDRRPDIYIDQFNQHTNEIEALAKLAAINPALAEKVIDQRDNEDRRANASYRFGLIATTVLMTLVLFSLTYLLVKIGVLASLFAIGGVLACALLIRVVLTGEWSDTSWFGKIVHSLASSLGAKTDD